MKKSIPLFFILNLIYSCSGGDSPTPGPGPGPTPVENKAPSAYGGVNVDNGQANYTDFIFNANQSTDPENKPMTYEVDVDGDGIYDTQAVSTNTNTSYKYTSAVNANPKIKVKDDKGLTSVYSLGKVGVWATDADKPQVSISSQNYIIAGNPTTVGVNVVEPNGLGTINDFFYGAQNKGNIGNETSFTPTADMIGSDLELRVRAETPYHIEGEKTKIAKVGSPIPHDWILKDKADGKEYYFGVNDGVVWMHQSYAGSVGEYYDNNPENEIFGKYLTAEEVDALEDVVMVAPDGREFQTHVPTTDEWDNLRRAYNENGDAGGKSKYVEFANGENVGATNENGMSLMLGGYYNPVENKYQDMGNMGGFFMKIGTDNANVIIISKDNDNLPRGLPHPGVKAPVRLILEL